MQYTLISLFADPGDTGYYSRHGKRLAAQCESLGVPHLIREMPNAGDWLKNQRLKGPFVEDALEATHGPVLWVDVDCELYRVPELGVYAEYDFAGVEFLFETNVSPRLLIMGATLFFNYTDGGRRLASAWARSCQDPANAEFGDHRLLSHLLHGNEWLRWTFLPDCYCQCALTRGDAQPVIALGLADVIASRKDILESLERRGLG